METKAKAPYFPTLGREVKCWKCDRQDCMSRNKFQRNRRDFTVTSGRCPRLPDYRGFVDVKDRELYEATFTLIHAERDEAGKLTITLTTPDMRRPRRVYFVKGYWYIRDKDPIGMQARRVITIADTDYIVSPHQIINRMDGERTNRCVFRCTVEDYFI